MSSNYVPSNSELGKKSEYQQQYNPKLLLPLPRTPKREEININPNDLPFKGYDCWNHYEVSWLNLKGKPIAAIAQIFYSSDSANIIESKSFKLYFNSFNNSKFDNLKEVESIIQKDVSEAVKSEVKINLYDLNNLDKNNLENINKLTGECLDNLDIECTDYIVNPELLALDNPNNQDIIEEVLYSDLLKSNCLVTYQPDWGSVQISYKGPKINRESLLKYIVSFRNHNEFHEQCIERIFTDILTICKPQELTVLGRYTRRGGLDINPYRTNKKSDLEFVNSRLIRQ